MSMTIISPDAPCRVELVADLACGGGEINDAGIIQHAAHLETARLQPILELPKVFVRSAEAGAELLGRQPLVILRCGSLLLASEEMIEVRLLLRDSSDRLRFGQRDETDAQMLQFLQRAEQVGDRAAPSDPSATPARRRSPGGARQFLASFALCRAGANLFYLHATVQLRRAAYSRRARFCIGSVCWSWVDTRAYRPMRNVVFLRPAPWPKTRRDSVSREARSAGIFHGPSRLASIQRFRPELRSFYSNWSRDGRRVIPA